jgi:hypothetical protein
MEGSIALKHNAAAVAAITAVRAPTGNEFFATKTQTAIAASSATHAYFDLINKHDVLIPPSSFERRLVD